MIRTIKALVNARLREASPARARRDPHTLELAAAALLLEVSRADDTTDALELGAVVAAIRASHELSDYEVELLLADAGQRVDDAVDYLEFTRILNARLDADEKSRLIEDLWRVAYVDGRLDTYEEHAIRKIADLLHVSHRDFIRAKHRAGG